MRKWVPGTVVVLLLACVCRSLPLMATADTVRVGGDPFPVTLSKVGWLLETSPAATLTEVSSSPNWKAANPQTVTRADRAYWLRATLKNDTDSTEHFYLYTADNQEVTLFSPATTPQRAGTLVATPDWTTDEEDTFLTFALTAGEVRTLYLRIARVPGWLPPLFRPTTPRPSLNLVLERQDDHYRRTYLARKRNLPELIYRSWIQGALAFWLLFVGLIYLRYRQLLYRHYFLYVLGAFLYALLKSRPYTPPGQWLSYFPLLRIHLAEVALWGGMAAYFFFIGELLQLRQSHPRAHRLLRQLGWAFAGYAVGYGAVMLLTNDGDFHRLAYRSIRFAGVGLSLATILWLPWNVRSPLTRYVVAGYGAMAAIGILAWLRGSELILKGMALPGSVDNLFTITFGVLLEILVFALALAHRIRLLDTERQESQKAYIEMVKKKSSFERQLAEVELQALRSQLNPHFLFNSLNSLEYYILLGDNAKASNHLTRFSKLLRMVLNHSRAKTISLYDELEVLRLYLEIEKNRFGDGFHYRFDLAPGLDQEAIRIPPLLLQPFVENAIWHGLLPSSQEDKMLEIAVWLPSESMLTIEIRDNGIGRRKSSAMKKNQATSHKSYGMEIIRQRIALFNQSYPSRIQIEVLDLTDADLPGTLVRISCELLYGDQPEEEPEDSATGNI